MSGLADKPSAIQAVVKGLADHLLATVTNLKSALDEFPGPNENLVMPAVAVRAKTPVYIPCQPYVISKGTVVNSMADVKSCIGRYDFTLQLDLWAAYKPQRDSLFEEIVNAFNQGAVHGINLTLSGYYDEIAHFGLDSGQYGDDEEGAQRGEWRAIWNVVASVRVVRVKSEPIIETIENTLETPEAIAVEAQAGDGSLII